MWRFIFVTFAFLGSAFYFLSGGAEYAPAPKSIQARAQAEGATLFAWPDPAQTRTQTRVAVAARQTSNATDDTTVSRSVVSLNDLSLAAKARPDAVHLHLASADGGQAHLPKLTTAAAKPGVGPSDEGTTAIPRDVTVASPIGDVRKVSGSSVNMRSGPGTKFGRLARLTGGTRVAVLRDPGDGWLKIRVVDTGRVGWMADWLVTASAN